MVRDRNRLEMRARVALTKELRRAVAHTVRLLRGDVSEDQALQIAQLEHSLRLRRILRETHSSAWVSSEDHAVLGMRRGIERLLRKRGGDRGKGLSFLGVEIELKDSIGAEEAAAIEALMREQSRNARSSWLMDTTPLAVQRVSETTVSSIRNALSGAAIAGAGIRGSIQAVNEINASSVPTRRAWTIARTEVHAAAEASTHEQMRAIGSFEDELEFRQVREWVAAEDERTRENHKRANGQQVGIEEPFRVGGTMLRHPGDPNGRLVSQGSGPGQSHSVAAEIINCRCVAVLELVDTGGG